MKQLRPLFLILVTAYLVGGVFLYLKQRDFLYFPTPAYNHDHQTKTLQIDGKNISVVIANSGEEKALLYFGGNAESVVNVAGDLAPYFKQRTLYLMEYRGYGSSTGQPTEESLYADALHLFDAISAKHSEISVIGRSLGSGVATYLASTRPVSKLVLTTPFDSVEHIARDQYPIYPVSMMLHDKFNSLSRVIDIKSPTLALLAERDNLVKPKYSSALISAFPQGQISVVTIPGSSHNSISHYPEYYLSIQKFLN